MTALETRPVAGAIADPVGEAPGSAEIGFAKADHPNASAVLFDNLTRAPDAIALTGPCRTLTYAQLCARAARWGHAFAAQGLRRGDRIAFLLDDGPDYAAAFFGAVRAGFVPVLLNTQSPPDLVSFYVADSGARIAVCESALARGPLAPALADVARMVVVGEEAVDAPNALPTRAFLEGRAEVLASADTHPEDMAFWMYSSGSTGRPKGIVHLQHDMAYTAKSYAAHVLALRPGDVCFSVPKLYFAYGFGNSLTFPFCVGASSVLLPGRPEPARVLDAIERYRPTVLFGLPTLYTALCRSPEAAARDLGSLRLSISAAEILSEDVARAWKSLSGLDAVEGLGSTEMLHIYLSNTPDDRRAGSAGRRVPGYEVALRDPEGRPVAPGAQGVMWVRGDSSAPCYWNRPDKTAQTMRGDWVHTGDRFVERDGFYYFQGRSDDLVKVSGQWVWPLEVERCLAEHPHVHECVVLAHRLADGRTTLRAVVRLRDGFPPGEERTRALQEHVKAALVPYKYPRIVDYVEEMPKTGTGKIDRRALARDP